jgi:hypothetical protein
MRLWVDGQHRPPRADNGEGEPKLHGNAVPASPRLRVAAPDAWWLSHPPERRSFRCASRPLSREAAPIGGSARVLTACGGGRGAPLRLVTETRRTRQGCRGTVHGTSTGRAPVRCVRSGQIPETLVQVERTVPPSSPLLIRGFGVRVPGGAPVLTWAISHVVACQRDGTRVLPRGWALAQIL